MKSTLSKREHFAGLAMQNIQNVLLRKSGHEIVSGLKEELKIDKTTELIARLAVIQADALLEALKSEPGI